ncbi:MAG: glycoside hydrolase family 25 protein [Oscillospiraceae bacterium]|nr:glycoside hydrolase family 25 protein [Oscillospiraceae bacterium]
MHKGIDVSRHNGAIDWQKVRDSGLAEFAVLRAGYGKLLSQKDSRFEEYYAQCQKYGIPVGCYWYSYAKSVAEIQTEANVFLKVIQGKKFEYPVYLDFEESSQFALGKAKCSEMAETFLKIMEQAGYFAGLYSSKSHLETYFTEEIRNRYAVWVAHYGVEKTDYSGQAGIWQKSEKGSVSGISGYVDLNECYADYPEIIRKAGLNGFSEQAVSAPEKGCILVTAELDGRCYSGILTEE